MANLDIAQYLRPGDTVLIGQGAAEPPALVEHFIAAAHAIGGLTAFCGYTLSDAWAAVSPGQPNIKAYVAHGALRKLSAKGLVDIVPCHYGRIEELIATGHIRVDVVLLQVAPADADGYYSLGATVDYAAVAAEQARVVLVEVNANMPRTSSSRCLHRSRVAASVTSSRVLAGSPARSATAAERAVAENVAAQLAPAALAECDPYVAMNSAIEVDLHGQVNAEVAEDRYVGAVGGQAGFFRAARLARSGLAIVALAATNADGSASRIVPAVSGPVTTAQSDVDLVIIEFGAADLRGTSYRERAERLIAVAAPQHRAALAFARPPWL